MAKNCKKKVKPQENLNIHKKLFQEIEENTLVLKKVNLDSEVPTTNDNSNSLADAILARRTKLGEDSDITNDGPEANPTDEPESNPTDEPDAKDNNKITLIYYDAKGSVETSRMILKYNNIDFEDIRYDIDLTDKNRMTFKSKGLIQALKKKRLLKSFNTLPLLEFNDFVLHQSPAIEYFLSEKFNMNGENDAEKAKIYSLCEYITLIKNDYQLFKIFDENNCKENEKEKEWFNTNFRKHLTFINENICNNSTNFSIGNIVSRLDFVIYNFVNYYFTEKEIVLDVISNFENILNVLNNLQQDRVFANILKFNKETSF
tara:strand:+ start:9141 stop:10091 length:951 start_codon:yes stop_codon:yes gene_type:complete